MEEISSIWEQIYKVSDKYFDNNITCECYRQMSTLFKTWSNIFEEQNNIINIEIREHFKYIRKNFDSMKELALSVDEHKYNYQKNVKNLMSKKDDLFKKGDISKWELDPKNKIDYSTILKDKKTAILNICHKETSNVINLKEFYGYYFNRIINEYERMRNLNGILNKDIIIANINKLTQISGKFLTCVAEINGELEAASINKSNDKKCQSKRIPFDES